MGAKQKTARILTKTIPFRKDFFRAIKEPTESPEQWLSRIKELTKSCCFGKNNDLFIFNKFIAGLEADLTDYLCSSVQRLDIQSSLDFIRVYEKQKIDVTFNATFVADQPEPPETIFSEILVKCEPDDDNQSESNKSFQFIDDNSRDSDFVWDDTFEDKNEEEPKNVEKNKDENETKSLVKSDNAEVKKVAKNENTTEIEEAVATIMPKLPVKKTRKEKQTHKTEELTNETNDTEIDPNVPKTKRKYKKRAVKEKQTFECEICQYKCAHQCHLRRHKLIHKNEKSFVCHMCGKAFNLFINMNAHLRRHVGFKPHSCEICNASFMDRTRLKLHMRTHTGEKPFSCNICDKKFADRYYLKVHMRLHTGEKPFQCVQCHKTFSQSSSLSTHKRKNCIIGQTPCD